MYICEKCGNTFDELKELKNMGGDIGENDYCCPYCGSDAYDEAIECAVCGDIVKESDSHECVCDSCLEKNANIIGATMFGGENYEWVSINGFYMQFFDSKHIEEILKTEMRKRYFNEEIEKKANEFCLMDRWQFAKWVKRVGAYL